MRVVMPRRAGKFKRNFTRFKRADLARQPLGKYTHFFAKGGRNGGLAVRTRQQNRTRLFFSQLSQFFL